MKTNYSIDSEMAFKDLKKNLSTVTQSDKEYFQCGYDVAMSKCFFKKEIEVDDIVNTFDKLDLDDLLLVSSFLDERIVQKRRDEYDNNIELDKRRREYEKSVLDLN